MHFLLFWGETKRGNMDSQNHWRTQNYLPFVFRTIYVNQLFLSTFNSPLQSPLDYHITLLKRIKKDDLMIIKVMD